MKLEDIDLSKLMPLFMRQEKDDSALADVFSGVLQLLAREISRLTTWDHLSDLSPQQKDDLAEELRIHWYNQDLPEDVKTLLLAKSDLVYSKLGTKAAVEEVIREVFDDPGAYVEEWYNYGGQPNFFRIQITNTAQMKPENEAKLLEVLEVVKRKSQWLDTIQNEIMIGMNLYVGFLVGIHTKYDVLFDTWQDHSPSSYYVGPSLVARQKGSESPAIKTD